MIKNILVMIILLYMCQLSAFGSDFEYGLKFYANKDYAGAAESFKKSAELGHAQAQVNLGELYAKGQGVNRDYHLAVSWFRKAADQGNMQAQFDLGVMYNNGLGVKLDYKQAKSWFCKSAEQGYAQAQYYMGYFNYYEVPESGMDYQQAIVWYRKAAAQGHARAQFKLGEMLDYGNGLAKDYNQAKSWYLKAAAQGVAIAQYRLGVETQDPELWFLMAAEQGYADAQCALGSLYSAINTQRGVKQDYIEAYKWLILPKGGEVCGARDREFLEKHMTSFQLDQAKQRATQWSNDHPQFLIHHWDGRM